MTIPNKSNPNPDLSDVADDFAQRFSHQPPRSTPPGATAGAIGGPAFSSTPLGSAFHSPPSLREERRADETTTTTPPSTRLAPLSELTPPSPPPNGVFSAQRRRFDDSGNLVSPDDAALDDDDEERMYVDDEDNDDDDDDFVTESRGRDGEALKVEEALDMTSSSSSPSTALSKKYSSSSSPRETGDDLQTVNAIHGAASKPDAATGLRYEIASYRHFRPDTETELSRRPRLFDAAAVMNAVAEVAAVAAAEKEVDEEEEEEEEIRVA